MTLDYDLRLHQEAVLLALKDQKGTPFAAMFGIGIGGAILTELVLEDRIRLEERKRGKPLVQLVSATQIGDPTLDDALAQVRDATKPAPVAKWLSRWARTKNLHEIARRLAQRGILRVEEKRVLLLFDRTVYPTMDAGPEQRLTERMRTAIFGEDEVDARTAAIVSLAHAVGLLKPIFGGKELKRRKERIEALIDSSAIGDATREAVRAAQAAVTSAAAASAAT